MQSNKTSETAAGPVYPQIVVYQPRQTVLWLIAVLLALIAIALVVRPEGRLALPAALADSPMAGARGIFAFTGQLDVNRYGLFMMDVDTRNVWCYEYLPGTRKARLVFARSFDYDRYLEDYNLDRDTAPEVVKKLLDEQRRIKDRNQRGGAGPDEDSEMLGTMSPSAISESPAQPPRK